MTLVMLGDDRKSGSGFDHLVVECTGVAEPREIRDNFVQMSLSDHMVGFVREVGAVQSSAPNRARGGAQ